MKVLCTAFLQLRLGLVTFWQKDFGKKRPRKKLMSISPTKWCKYRILVMCTFVIMCYNNCYVLALLSFIDFTNGDRGNFKDTHTTRYKVQRCKNWAKVPFSFTNTIYLVTLFAGCCTLVYLYQN